MDLEDIGPCVIDFLYHLLVAKKENLNCLMPQIHASNPRKFKVSKLAQRATSLAIQVGLLASTEGQISALPLGRTIREGLAAFSTYIQIVPPHNIL